MKTCEVYNSNNSTISRKNLNPIETYNKNSIVKLCNRIQKRGGTDNLTLNQDLMLTQKLTQLSGL